jgi:uncharacterized protein (DUF433 family)
MLNWSKCSDVESVPGKMSGAWVFKGTRLPIATLFDNLAHGASLKDFLEWYPGVSEEQVQAVLKFVVDHSQFPEDHPILATV